MRRLDAYQFRQTIKEGDVSCSHHATGHQVVEGSTDVQHHVTGRFLLVAIGGQFEKQGIYHLCG